MVRLTMKGEPNQSFLLPSLDVLADAERPVAYDRVCRRNDGRVGQIELCLLPHRFAAG